MRSRIILAAAFAAFLALPAYAQIPGGGGGVPKPVVNGECLIGSGGKAVWGSCSGSGTAVTSVTGTTGQITASPTTGDVILTLPATITEVLTFSGANAYGTPSSITLTNGTGLPLAGLTGAGTGVVTALGVNVGSAGAVLVNGGALGTPSSGTLTNATGLPVAGLSNLGANVGTFLITPSSANLASALTDETGSGLAVFATNPSLAGATLTGTLALGTQTVSGGFTMSGVPLMTGLSAGTQTKCLGLDSGNHIVYVASACGSGGGSAWDITDGTHTVTSVTGLTVGNGFLIGGSAGAATLNGTNTLNTQSGTGAYAILAGDAGLQVVRTNASGGADTIAAASTTNFTSGYSTMYTANGQAGNTITPASGTIGGLSVLKVGKNQSVSLDSDGTNYNVAASVPIPATQTDTLWLSDDFVWRTKPLASASVFGLAKVDGTTITASGGVLTATAGGSGCTVSGAAGAVFNTGSSTCTTDTSILATAGALSLGASGTAGSVAMGNATTGTITLQPVTGALGSVTASLPANTGTIAELNLAQTWTAAQTNSAAAPQLILGVNTSTLGAIKMFGNTSGDVTIEPNAVAGTSTIMKVPAWGATGNVAAIDVAQTFTASQTFGQVQGKNTAQSGTTYSFAATDCGTEVIFTSGSAVTATIPASIVPAAGTGCVIAINQSGAGKVSVNGSAVTPATLVSAHSYTATSGTAGSEIALRLTTIGATATATLTGDGS